MSPKERAWPKALPRRREVSRAAANWARTLGDLGELTAQWLLGALDPSPVYEGSPESETDEIVEHLVTFNRGGFVTVFSQAGTPRPLPQRAAVTGFCADENARRLLRLSIDSDLVAVGQQPGTMSYLTIPISVGDGRDYIVGHSGAGADIWADADPDRDIALTFLGHFQDHEELEYTYMARCPRAVGALKNAWQVAIFDPIWGRNDLLWTTVLAALTA